MVYLDKYADMCLKRIFYSLLDWKTENGQPHMDREHCEKYFISLANKILDIEKLSIHRLANTETLKQYATFCYRCKINYKTSWYVCYEIMKNDFYVKAIINNYTNV